MDNFETYRALTKARDWSGICRVNGFELETAGVNNELGELAEHLQEDETVFALTYGKVSQTERSKSIEFGPNVWLIALTDRRLLAVDHAVLTKSVTTHSVGHDKVLSVSAAQGWMLSKVLVDIGDRSIIIRAFQKATVSAFVELATSWIGETGKPDAGPQNPEISPMQELERLAALKSSGVLSKDEFEATKKRILAQF